MNAVTCHLCGLDRTGHDLTQTCPKCDAEMPTANEPLEAALELAHAAIEYKDLSGTPGAWLRLTQAALRYSEAFRRNGGGQ